ncbi:MAG: hypothetical protein COA61_009890 [Zetaproteobacteria bacterium]|nr:hypothetical protein [Zetaproteobacteria bacterium]MDQ6953278.1 hypothetical protein [Mariprofundaceae bacterium]
MNVKYSLLGLFLLGLLSLNGCMMLGDGMSDMPMMNMGGDGGGHEHDD